MNHNTFHRRNRTTKQVNSNGVPNPFASYMSPITVLDVQHLKVKICNYRTYGPKYSVYLSGLMAYYESSVLFNFRPHAQKETGSIRKTAPSGFPRKMASGNKASMHHLHASWDKICRHCSWHWWTCPSTYSICHLQVILFVAIAVKNKSMLSSSGLEGLLHLEEGYSLALVVDQKFMLLLSNLMNIQSVLLHRQLY